MASPIPHKEYVEHWSVEQVSAWLQQVQLAECCEVFLRRGVDGHSLMQINEESLLLWPDVSVRNRRRILKLISQINVQASPMAPKPKIMPPANHQLLDKSLPHESDEEIESEECEINSDDPGFSTDEFEDPQSPDFKPATNASKNGQLIPSQNFGSNHRFGSSGTTESVRPPPRPPVPHPPNRAKPVVNSDGQPTRSDDTDEDKDEVYLIPKHQSESQSSGGMSASIQAVASIFGQAKPNKNSQLVPSQNFAGGNHRFGSSGATEGVRSPPRPPVPHPPIRAKPVVNSDGQPTTRPDDTSEDKDEVYLIPKHQSESQPSGGMSTSIQAVASIFGQTKSSSTGTKPLGIQNSQATTTNHRLALERHQHSNGLALARQPNSLENKWSSSQEAQSSVTQPVQPSAEHEYEQVLPAKQPLRCAGILDKTRAPPELPPRNPPSEAVTEFRMLSSSRSSVPRGCDSISSLSSISASSLVDSLVPSTAMAPSANIANRCPWMAQESIHGSAFPKSSSVQLPKNTSAPLRPGYNPSLQGADKGYTRHIPPKGTSPAPAKSSYALAPPRPPALQKPSLPSLNSSASDPTTKATGLENFRIKCTVSLGEGETVILEQVHIDLMNEPWFHMITRKKAEKYVMNSKDGTFLIRPSTRNIDPLTLCLRYQGRTYNIPIRQRTSDKCFALGMEKANELAFKTVPLLVEAYHEKPIKLQTGNRTLLKDTPPKLMENVYVKHSTSSA